MKINAFFSRAFPFLIFVSGILYFCFRILNFDLTYVPGDLGDSRFIHFLLEHGHRWLAGNDSSFWNFCHNPIYDKYFSRSRSRISRKALENFQLVKGELR